MWVSKSLRVPLGGRVAAVCLVFVTAAVLCAGDGADVRAIRPASTNDVVANAVVTNVLQLWIDVRTNASRSEGLSSSVMIATNLWLPSGRDNLTATTSVWRTSATIETGFFHGVHFGGPGCSGDGRRGLDGWFQEVGVGVERDLGPDSGMSIGIGVGVSRATLH